jgi:hypothetical protein
VAAGVADFGEGIHFGADDDLRANGTDGSVECRFQPPRRPIHHETVLAQELGEAFGCPVFLMGELRVAVHEDRDVAKLRLELTDRYRRLIFRTGHQGLRKTRLG